VLVRRDGRVRASKSEVSVPEEAYLGIGLTSSFPRHPSSLFTPILTQLRNLSDEGPAGPTAFWKVSNEVDEERDEDDEDDDTDDPDFPGYADEDEDEDDEMIFHIPGHVIIVSHHEDDEVEQEQA
jgi:hypothetical protein